MDHTPHKDWLCPLISIVAFIFVVFIFKKELSHRKSARDQYSTATIAESINIHQRWLCIHSTSTFVLCILSIFSWTLGYALTFKFNLCISILCVTACLWVMTKCALSFFSIARLQYCFSAQQVHSAKYGYPRCLFVFLYLMGVCLLIYVVLLCIYLYDLHLFHGCEITITRSDILYKLCVIAVAAYIIWDWFILLLYVVKICQINRKRNKSNAVMTRVRAILYKVLSLTLFVEIGLIVSFAVAVVNLNANELINAVLFGMDCVFTVIGMYLMIEHNDEQYQRVRSLCCFCRADVSAAMTTRHIQQGTCTHYGDGLGESDTFVDIPLPDPVLMAKTTVSPGHTSSEELEEYQRYEP